MTIPRDKSLNLCGTWLFNDKTTCKTLELLDFTDEAEPVLKEGALDDGSLGVWLEEVPGRERMDGSGEFERAKGGMRVLILDYIKYPDGWEMHCTEEVSQLLHKHMKSPRDFLPGDMLYGTCLAYIYTSMENNIPRYIGLVVRLPGSWLSVCGMLVICHDKNTHQTHAILTSQDGVLSSKVIAAMKMKTRNWTDPVVTVLEFLSKVLINLCEYMEDVNLNLVKISKEVGHYDYAGMKSTIIPNLDFLSTSRTLNMSGTDAACLTAYFSSLLQVLGKLKVFKKAVEEGEEEGGERKAVGERIDVMVDVCEAFLTEAKKSEKECNVLLQVFYQFMAQNDAKVNIELAKSSAAIAKASREDSAAMKTIALESKKDSAAMKTISILGMLFLPGTFIACDPGTLLHANV